MLAVILFQIFLSLKVKKRKIALSAYTDQYSFEKTFQGEYKRLQLQVTGHIKKKNNNNN